MVFLQETKCTIFINQSTNAKIASKFLEDGKSIMKSMETEDQDFLGIDNGCQGCYR
jgi:hypothetical protein